MLVAAEDGIMANRNRKSTAAFSLNSAVSVLGIVNAAVQAMVNVKGTIMVALSLCLILMFS